MNKNGINIGLIGCGTVGSHFVKAINSKSRSIKEKTGINFCILKICDKDNKRKRILPAKFTTQADEILNNKDIDIVVELIGGVGTAYSYINRAVANGKSVVTANKALLSQKGKELFSFAQSQNVYIGFEASVGGAIPIIKVLRECFIGNEILKVYAILNGTTNFILSNMTNSKADFKEALLTAGEKGYAESNPHLDISGFDSAHKLAIIALFAFNKQVSMENIHTEGIDRFERIDIEFARQFGYRVKLLSIGKVEKNKVQLRVHPALLPEKHLLSSVEDVHNAVYIEGDLIGKSLLYGEGAGGNAAASAVLADVVDIGMKIKTGGFRDVRAIYEKKTQLLNFEDITTKYYLRFTVLDQPGVLAEIARILGKNGISIDSVIQKKKSPRRAVPVVMLTHFAREKEIQKAIVQINSLEIIKKPTILIRVEE